MGLESAESRVRGEKVENYISLFKDVDDCNNFATTIIANVLMTLCLLIGTILVNNH